ncbi:MAG: hypothetical protein M3Z75_21135 [Actinomycetota bacterium]|nr:hypothetical protein [Actinomycetota bacterium]
MTPIPGVFRRPAAIGLSAAALTLLAACSSGGSGSSTGTPASTGTTAAATGSAATGSAATGSAGSALLTAATQAQNINSAATTLHVQVTGSQASSETGTFQYQRTPTLMSEDMHIAAEGGNTGIKMILTGTDMYFSEPGLPAGKAWIKFSLAALKGKSASFARLVQSMQSNNFTNQAQLFAVAKNAHEVGTATIDGVATTEYAGSFRASDAINALSPGVRGVLGAQLKTLGDSVISFHEWIDGQHHMRQVIENETVKGQAVTTTLNVTAINQPVQIPLPPASQTASS